MNPVLRKLLFLELQGTRPWKQFSQHICIMTIGSRSPAANKRIHSDSKKRRSFAALLFAAGDARR